MYETSDIRKGLKVKIDGEPYIVVDFQFVKPGKGVAFTRTRLKNLLTGLVVEKTFRSGEKLEPAVFEEKVANYTYFDGNTFHFMDSKTYEDIEVEESILGENKKFLQENMEITILYYRGKIVSIQLPYFVELKVTYTEQWLKGDTATGATKPAIVETGAEVLVPLFINEGDIIKIDTRSGEYVERVKIK